MTTLVCRDAAGAARVARLLIASGEPALAVPLISFVSLPGGPAHTDDLLITSVHAADRLAEGAPRFVRLLALEGPTSARLRALGFTPDVTVGGGAYDLAMLAGPVPTHLTSDVGGAETLRARPDARLWVGYRNVPLTTLPPIPEPYALWFGSPSAVHAWRSLASPALSAPVQVWAHGATTLATLTTLGIPVAPRTFPAEPE